MKVKVTIGFVAIISALALDSLVSMATVATLLLGFSGSGVVVRDNLVSERKRSSLGARGGWDFEGGGRCLL